MFRINVLKTIPESRFGDWDGLEKDGYIEIIEK